MPGLQWGKAAETAKVFIKAVENRKVPKRQYEFAETGKSEKKLRKVGIYFRGKPQRDPLLQALCTVNFFG